MKLASMRLRLLLWNTGILAIALLCFQLLALLMIRTNLQSELDNRLNAIAEGPVHFFSGIEQEGPPPPPPPPPHPHQVNQQPAISRTPPAMVSMQRMIRNFDLQGKGLANPDNFPSTLAAPWDRAALARASAGHIVYSVTRDSDNTLLRVLSRPLQRNGQRIGVVQVAISYEEMKTLLNTLATMMLLLVPCVLLVAGVVGVILTDRALRPVRQIIRTAETLNPDDLSQRLPAQGADEFAHLATTMNGMLSRIETAFVKLQLTLDRERRFTADASHELRTPLTAITANATLTLEGDTTVEEYREAMQSINLAAIMMRRLVEDLLLLARSDSGQLPLTCTVIVVRDLLGWATEMVRKNAPRAEIATVITPGSEALWGDERHLLRVLINLLENALRHTPAEGRIILASQHHDSKIELSVTDTGEGIPPEQVAHLGERFYRLDASRARQHGGSGLGLAICKGIVEAHHGILTINSKPGHGTTVTMVLPDQGRGQQ